MLHSRPKVTRMEMLHPGQKAILRRKCAYGGSPGLDGECAECRSKRLSMQRSATPHAGPSAVPPIVHEVLGSPGHSLDAGTRAFMEPRFGHDFSHVRVHTDSKAEESARAVNALAYTVGRDVVFGTRRYAPGTSEEKRLLAHELTHVVQDRGQTTIPDTNFTISSVDTMLENEADYVANNMAFGLEQLQSKTTEREKSPAQRVKQIGKFTPTLYRQHHSHRNPHRQPSQQPGNVQCHQPIQPASNFAQYVDLVRRAEAELIRCGHRNLETRLHILTGIYYGTPWSQDYTVEHSSMRNLGFETYTARGWTTRDNPRSCLGCGLFFSLRRSQDVGGVDMGHTLIGMDARMRSSSREGEIPLHGATGMEITTWVGDLGGATARLALDRVTRPNASPARYFRGTDYGAASNLEGDVAASVVAEGSSSTITAPTIPPGGTIADALEAYLVMGVGRTDRCHRFLVLQGAAFAGERLTNRSHVEQIMAGKFSNFGRWYMANHLIQHGRFNPMEILAANSNLHSAAADIAHHFIDWLLTVCMGHDIPASSSEQRRGR